MTASYNSLPYEQIISVGRSLAKGTPILPPFRGFDCLKLVSKHPVVAKERPRDGTFHTPPATRKYAALLAKEITQGMKDAGFPAPFMFPVTIDLEIRQAPYKTWNAFQVQLAKYELLHVTKRDLDNLVKAITDAFNNVVYIDDRLIVQMNARAVVSQNVGFTAYVTPAGLTKNETDRACNLARQIRAGKLN